MKANTAEQHVLLPHTYVLKSALTHTSTCITCHVSHGTKITFLCIRSENPFQQLFENNVTEATSRAVVTSSCVKKNQGC